MNSRDSRNAVAPTYLKENFEPSDRLAVVLVHKPTRGVLQRLATAEQIAAPDFQGWLRHKNADPHEVYIAMNALKDGARGRTKADVATIWHIYLDFDDQGPRRSSVYSSGRTCRSRTIF